MDNLWEQHRTFILKVMAGAGVFLVLLIVHCSMQDKSQSDWETENSRKWTAISSKKVPSKTVIAEHQAAFENLESRMRFLAGKVGETRKGDELRRGIVSEILARVGTSSTKRIDRYLNDARTAPKACIVALAGEVNEYLNNQASLVNVVLERDLGSVVEDMEDAELDRYLICLKLIMGVLELAIEQEIYEVKNVSIGAPPGGRFEGEAVFVREYPVNLEIRGPADSILEFLEKLNDPDRFVPVTELRQVRPDRATRGKGIVVADLELAALKIDTDAEQVERMDEDREKWFAAIVVPLAILLAVWSYMDVYAEKESPKGKPLDAVAPEVLDFPDRPAPERFNMNVARLPALPDLVPDSGRTILEPYSDLLPVEKAVLSLPRELLTPVVLPPVSPFAWVPFYRKFRVAGITPVAKPAEEEEPLEPPEELLPDEPEELDTEEVLESKKKEFVESEWDSLTLLTGGQWFGRISLTKEARDRGLTKYHLLLHEHRELEFYFEKRNTATGKIESTGKTSLAKTSVQHVGFADTIENRYWSRRVESRVELKDLPAVIGLGLWIRDLAEEERYDRTNGLELAAMTFKEALEEKPNDLEATLELGETYHRAFRFDDEVALYDSSFAEREAPELLVRKARVLEKLGLSHPAEQALGQALVIAPGDTAARLARAEVRYELGRTGEPMEREGWFSKAHGDFSEVQASGSPEEKTRAKEGRARTLLARGEPDEAERLLGADLADAESHNTLGCARYARKDFSGAVAAFEKALELDPEFARAATNLGIAQVQAARTWDEVETAIANLERARTLDPLNYFFPPLGLGFAEQRRGHRDERPEHLANSVDQYLTAELALPTEPYVHYILGVSYLRDENYEGAKREFQAALKLDYRFSDALLGIGTASLFLEDWEGARNHIIRALQVEGESVFTRYRLGRAYLLSEDLPMAKRYRMAKEQFEKVLATDPQHVPSLNALGYIAYQIEDVEGAHRHFGQARDLAPEGKDDLDRLYAIGSKALIADAQSRRLWLDSFDRGAGAKVANGWGQTSLGAVTPRIQNGSVLVKGLHATEGALWLLRGSKTLNGAFIAVEAVVDWRRSDHVNNRFLIFQRKGNQDEDTWNQVGIAKNARGEVVVFHKKQSEKVSTRIVVKDEDGNALSWPTGEVVLRIERSNHSRGIFTLYFNEEQIAEVEAGIRRRAGTLELGFRFQSTPGESHESRILEVRIEQYVQ